MNALRYLVVIGLALAMLVSPHLTEVAAVTVITGTIVVLTAKIAAVVGETGARTVPYRRTAWSTA